MNEGINRLQRKWGIAAIGLVFWLTTSVSSGVEDVSAPLTEAQAALKRGNYTQSFAEFRRIAEEQNNPLAQFNVALFYRFGWDRPADAAEACRWFERAAAGKIPVAPHYSGDCLRQGVQRPADPVAAAHWYNQAARNGHLLSLCALADLYIVPDRKPL